MHGQASAVVKPTKDGLRVTIDDFEHQKIYSVRVKNGVGYVLNGKGTFKAKEQIKAAGGRWLYGRWICPVKFTENGITSKQINLSGHVGGGSVMWLDDFDLYEAITD